MSLVFNELLDSISGKWRAEAAVVVLTSPGLVESPGAGAGSELLRLR